MSDIKGYKVLTDEQKSHLNATKNLEAQVLNFVKSFVDTDSPPGYELDRRWASIARTHFEEGFMAFCRSITSPDTVEFKQGGR